MSGVRRGLIVLAAAAQLAACGAESADRDTQSRNAGDVEISSALEVRVSGGSITEVIAAAGDTPARVRVRAQSLDLRIDVLSTGCAASSVIIEVSQLPESVESTWRPLLDAVSAEAAAARESAGGVVDFVADAEDRDRTPLSGERPFEGERIDRTLVWTVHSDRSRSLASVVPGVAEVLPVEPGACAALDAAGVGPLGQAALVVRHRLSRPIRGPFTFAVWGNNSGNSDQRARLIESVNASDALFAVINGDLTSEGTRRQLRAASTELEALTIPWFATPGDKDASSDLDAAIVESLGATTFAFDVGSVRLMVADSGDAAFTERTHDLVSTWLTDAALWWPSRPAPPMRLLMTHVPPFDPFGARNRGFKSRQDAARVIASLQRNGAPLIIASEFSTFDRYTVGKIEIVNSGGAGAPIETTSDAAHHWLQVDVGARCSPPAARGAAVGEACEQTRCTERQTASPNCPCAGRLWCESGTCAACITVTQRPF